MEKVLRKPKHQIGEGIAAGIVGAISGWFFMNMNILYWPYSFYGLLVITVLYLLIVCKIRRPEKVIRTLLYAIGAIVASWWVALPFILLIYLLECTKNVDRAFSIVATFIIIVGGTIFCFLRSDWYPTKKDKVNFFMGVLIPFAITVSAFFYFVIA